MNYVDTHSHLHFPQFDKDREEVIVRMKERGVTTIAVGVDYDSSAAAVALAKQYPDVVVGATIGVHPNEVKQGFDGAVFEEIWTSDVHIIKGVGECGLDFYRSDPLKTYETQKDVFQKQITFAVAHDLPLMLHVRPSKGSDDAHEAALALLKEAQKMHGDKVRGTSHFFTGSLAMAREYWNIGFCTSFPGVITFAKETEEVVREAPAHLMLSETDAPYAAPKPYRGERNEPTYVIEVVKKIAEIRGESEEYVATLLQENSERVFGV